MSDTTPSTADNSLSARLAALPAAPGCYLFRNASGEVIYVGKAVNLRNRVRSYFQKGAAHPPRTAQMVRLAADVEWMVTDNEVEALILESTLIKKHRPYFNVRLKDDKSYPYVCVTINDPYPRVFFTRRHRLTRDGNLYFGPFTNARAVRDTLRTARRIFGIQSCRPRFTGQERLRPCLYYHLNQCLGPCTGEVDRQEYLRAVRQVCKLFEGRHDEVIRHLSSQMEEASESLQFERAAALRDRIRAISQLAERQKVFSVDGADQDVVGLARQGGDAVAHVFFIRAGRLIGQENFALDADPGEPDSSVVEQFLKQYYEGAATIPAEILVPVEPEDAEAIRGYLSGRRGRGVRLTVPRRGEKRKLVEMVTRNAALELKQRVLRGVSDRARAEQACMELAEALGLETPPVRIECFDISNLQGGYAVGSMAVFEDGLPARKEYRHFRVRSVEGQDDFASLREVIGRRLANAREGTGRFGELPDLMLIDGGRGQLSAALEAVRLSGIEGLAVASVAKKEEEIFLPGNVQPVRLDRRSAALRLVQHVRDEAHRFAVTYHRKLRGKGSLASLLDSVPGIGPARRARLIRHFGSVEEMRRLSVEELARAPGMNRAVAAALYERLHEGEDGEGVHAA